MNANFEMIADGLADQGYAICDDFLTPEEVKDILILEDFERANEKFQRAGIGKKQTQQINEAIRGDYIQWLDRTTCPAATRVYLDRLDQLIQFLNQSLYLSMKDYEVHMTVYPAGTYYKRHLDQFKSDDHRKLSVICYLNPNWKSEYGGQLRMFLKDGEQDVLPLAGRLVCFRSDLIEHEVVPATRDRKSITGWILDQLSDLRHL
jgi:SM-20-related protein